MKRLTALLLLLALLALATAAPACTKTSPPTTSPPGTVTATSNGIALSGSVDYTFPTSMTFKVSARGDSPIVDLRLHYVVDHQTLAPVVSEGWAIFNPATSVDTQWFWDMRKASLPPGAQLEYWWTAADAAGGTAQTERAAVSFDDNRYSWQSITSDPITLYWYKGDQNFANTLMNAAQDGLKRIEDNTGAQPQGSVRIYIYASAQDFQSAEIFAQQWEGGATFVGYDIIAVGVATSQLSYGERAVPHELTHWIVHQVTFNNYGAGLPVWLDEGLATYGEGTLSPDYKNALDFAISNNQLISIRSLSSPFSAVTQQAYISYAESNSVVTFMIDQYGKDKMVQLLHVFQQGSGYDAALEQVYGFDQDGLDALWRQSLGLQ